MDRKTAIEFLGKTGEKIVSNFLTEMGQKVQHSIDNFDREKDFLVDGRKVEVKTEQPYVLKNAISIRDTQLKKCRSVDELYVVTIPPLFSPNYRWGGVILKVDPKTFECKSYTTKLGTKMIEIAIEQHAVQLVKKLTEQEKKELLKYASSAYDRKNF